MGIMELGAIGELVGGVAVIASISDGYFQIFQKDVQATCRQYPALSRMMDAGFMSNPSFRNMEIFERVISRQPEAAKADG